MPSQRRSSSTPSSPPGRFRAGSVSSIRSSSQSPNLRFATALSALPTWSDPVGLGAKRTRVMSRTYRGVVQRFVDLVRAAARYLALRPRLRKSLQAALVVLTLIFCAWAVRNEWGKAEDRLRRADAVQ